MDTYIVYTNLAYDDIALTRNESLEVGRYNLLVKNMGFDSTYNKTKLEISIS